jgi:hypothetical protein
MPITFGLNGRQRASIRTARSSRFRNREIPGSAPGEDKSERSAVFIAKLTELICGEGIHADSPRGDAKFATWPKPLNYVWRPRWIVSLCLFCWLWPKSAAHAQQAFYSALSLDSVIQSQNNTNPVVAVQPDQPHLGPVQLTLIPYTRVGIDDNINLTTTNTESDVIVGVGSTLGAAWQATGKSVVQLSAQIGYNFYFNHPDHDYLQISPGSALTWGFKLSDWLVTFFDQFNYTRNDIAVASVSNVSGIPIVDNTLGMRAQWQPGNWLLEAGYSYDTYFSTSSQYNYLDNDSDYFFSRGAWLYSEHGQLGIEGSASYTYFSHPPQNNNNSYSVGPYVQWQPDPFITVSVHGGPTFYSFAPNASNPIQNNLSSYYASLDVTHQMTEFLSEELTLNRSVSLGIGSGSPYYQQLSIDYLVRWYAKPWLNFYLRLDYQQGQQPYQQGYQFVDRPPFIVPFYATEYYNREGVSPGVTYQLTRKLTANLSYTHWTRGSNFTQNTYSDDSATFQLQYSF